MRQSDGLLRRVAAVSTAFAVVVGAAVAINQGLSSADNHRDNLLDYSGFRMGAEGWDIRSTAHVDVRRTSPGALGSKYALRLSPAATADVTLVDQRQGLPSTQRDTLYRAIAYVRGGEPRVNVNLRLAEVRGTDVVGSRQETFTTSEAGWKRLVIRYRAQSGESQLQLAVEFPRLAANSQVFVDHLRVNAVGEDDRGNTPDNPEPPGRGDSGTMFGASVYQGGQSWEAAVAASDQRFGGHEVIRVFHPGLPSSWPGRAGAVDRPVVVSFKAPPTQVVAGNYDDELLSWFRNAPRDRTIWWSYWHEPEDNVKSGDITAQQWRDAFRRIAGLADRADNPMLRSTVILMCWTANPNSGRSLTDFFPGRDVVDTIGWDCYNKASDNYLDPQTMFARAIAASRNFGVGFGIAELGSKLRGGDTSGANRAAWLHRVGAHLADEGAEFVTYFDSLVPGGDFRLDAAGQQAWRAVIDS